MLTVTIKPFGQLLRDLREARGLSRRQLGKLSEVSNVYIGKLEAGRTKTTTLIMAQKLAKGLAVAPDVFFQEEGVQPYKRIKEGPLHYDTSIPMIGVLHNSAVTLDQKHETITIPPELLKNKEPCKLFALKVSGDKLDAEGIHDGDLIIVEILGRVILTEHWQKY